MHSRMLHVSVVTKQRGIKKSEEVPPASGAVKRQSDPAVAPVRVRVWLTHWAAITVPGVMLMVPRKLALIAVPLAPIFAPASMVIGAVAPVATLQMARLFAKSKNSAELSVCFTSPNLSVPWS